MITVFYEFTDKENYPSNLAGQVAELANEVEKYVEQNNRLPSSLSLLSSFPTDATEWPITHYQTRMLELKKEFFLIDRAYSFAILGRYGEEEWIYIQGEDTPLQRLDSD